MIVQTLIVAGLVMKLPALMVQFDMTSEFSWSSLKGVDFMEIACIFLVFIFMIAYSLREKNKRGSIIFLGSLFITYFILFIILHMKRRSSSTPTATSSIDELKVEKVKLIGDLVVMGGQVSSIIAVYLKRHSQLPRRSASLVRRISFNFLGGLMFMMCLYLKSFSGKKWIRIAMSLLLASTALSAMILVITACLRSNKRRVVEKVLSYSFFPLCLVSIILWFYKYFQEYQGFLNSGEADSDKNKKISSLVAQVILFSFATVYSLIGMVLVLISLSEKPSVTKRVLIINDDGEEEERSISEVNEDERIDDEDEEKHSLIETNKRKNITSHSGGIENVDEESGIFKNIHSSSVSIQKKRVTTTLGNDKRRVS